MKTNQVFWDASAVVPLCAHETDSARARQIFRQYPDQVVWWGTIAEARSALARANRNGWLSSRNKQSAIRQLERLSLNWHEVAPDGALRESALQLLDAHSLRTGDAFQLAAALSWCDEKPRRRVFVCFDFKLAEAAKAVGFTVTAA